MHWRSAAAIAGPMPVDAVKLSHHGSRANVTQDLLQAVDARHFVFSTNNSYFRHPNAEAVARVIVGGRKPTLWFNYDTPVEPAVGRNRADGTLRACGQVPGKRRRRHQVGTARAT